jgi:hypothetical protein
MAKRTPLVAALLLLTSACPTTPPETTPGPCDSDDACDDGETCTEVDGEPTCVAPCDLANPCPADTVCTEQDGAAVCVPTTGELIIGEPCNSDLDCASGACAIEPAGPVCVMDCTAGEICLTGTRCMQSGPRLLCLSPLDDRADGEACETPRDCLSSFCVKVPHLVSSVCAASCDTTCGPGLACVPIEAGATVCVDAAADGETCTTAAVCAGGTCITDVDETSYCTSPCVDGDCATEGWACMPTVSDVDVCMPPLDDKVAGEACASARECASGHCGSFATDTEDLGDLCADPCDAEGLCAVDLVCWSTTVGPDLCGPIP